MIFVFVVGFLFSNQVSAIPGYSVIDLGTLGGDQSLARGINDNGQVVGSSKSTPDSAVQDPFIWQNGEMTDLETLYEPNFADASAHGINNEGAAVGSSWTSGLTGGEYHATLWKEHNIIDLGTLGGHVSTAYDINISNQVVGMSYTTIMPNQPQGAFLWENGEMTYLGTLGGEITMTNIGSSANAINNGAEIVGRASYDDTTYRHAFIWENGEMTDLGALDGLDSEAYDINESGQIVGQSSTGEYWSVRNAVLWQDGEIIDLGRLGGITSFAYGINESGQIVGRSHTGSLVSPDEYHGFIWQNGSLSDLNDLTNEGADWIVNTASDINDKGQIVGWGYNPALDINDFHALLLDPEWDAIITTDQYFLTDYLTLGDTFSFDYWWEMGQEPTGFNLDILIFRGTEWEVLGWELTTDGSSAGWETASFWVPDWARGLEAKIRFNLFDLGQDTDPTVYLRNITSSGSAPVPEPSTIILLGTGLIGLAGLGRKKFKAR